MSGIFTPPPGYSPRKLGFFAALGFAMATATLVPTLDRDAGIPDVSALAEAHGRVTIVGSLKHGVKFRLQGQAGIFEYPSKAGGNGVVESALRAAGTREVSVLFNPEPREPLFSAEPYYDVWQVAIQGKPVRTFEKSKDGWRSDNAVGAWLCASFVLFSAYLSLLAVRARRLRRFA
jgi:hypothetical protein